MVKTRLDPVYHVALTVHVEKIVNMHTCYLQDKIHDIVAYSCQSDKFVMLTEKHDKHMINIPYE